MGPKGTSSAPRTKRHTDQVSRVNCSRCDREEFGYATVQRTLPVEICPSLLLGGSETFFANKEVIFVKVILQLTSVYMRELRGYLPVHGPRCLRG